MIQSENIPWRFLTVENKSLLSSHVNRSQNKVFEKFKYKLYSIGFSLSVKKKTNYQHYTCHVLVDDQKIANMKRPSRSVIVYFWPRQTVLSKSTKTVFRNVSFESHTDHSSKAIDAVNVFTAFIALWTDTHDESIHVYLADIRRLTDLVSMTRAWMRNGFVVPLFEDSMKLFVHSYKLSARSRRWSWQTWWTVSASWWASTSTFKLTLPLRVGSIQQMNWLAITHFNRQCYLTIFNCEPSYFRQYSGDVQKDHQLKYTVLLDNAPFFKLSTFVKVCRSSNN